jgi:hypothetical protein
MLHLACMQPHGEALTFEDGNVTLVHRGSIVAVLDLFALAFFSAASARGQWKSPFPLAVFLFSHQWKFSRLFLNFQSVLKFIYIYSHKHIYIYILILINM